MGSRPHTATPQLRPRDRRCVSCRLVDRILRAGAVVGLAALIGAAQPGGAAFRPQAASFPIVQPHAVCSSGGIVEGSCTYFAGTARSAGNIERTNVPSGSNVLPCSVGLKTRKYGAASVPVEADHCQPPLFLRHLQPHPASWRSSHR